MNIQEAIKTNKRIRRPNFLGYCRSNGVNLIWDSGVSKFTCVEDILANDWEVEQENLVLTEEEI